MNGPWDWLTSMGGIINGAISDLAHGQINMGGVNVEDSHGRDVFDAQFLLKQYGIYCSVQPLGKHGELFQVSSGFLSITSRDRTKAVKILNDDGYTAWVTPI